MFLWSSGNAIEMECNANGECSGDGVLDLNSCGLYIAESTIPSGGLGIFLGTKLTKGSVVDTVSDILVHDIEENRQVYEYLSNETLPFWALRDSTWDYAAKNEADAAAIVSPGIGSLANMHLGFANVEKIPCSRFHDVPRMHPMVGSKTSFMNCSFQMTQDASAGSELFLSPSFRNFGDSPTDVDRRLDPSFKEMWEKISHGLSNAMAVELWDSAAKGDGFTPQTLIPKLPMQRSLSWLKENGVCIDQVYVNAKTEDQFDQGLFAKRDFKTNGVITTSPVRILSRSHLDITILDKESEPKKEMMWRGKQLLLNSCFGDSSSSLLFFPLDSRVQSISHPKDGQSANIGVRWSSQLSQNKELFDMLPKELLQVAKNFDLAFEFYALSDIAAGDELLFHFGAAWENAWHDHVRSWAPDRIVHSKDYVPAHEYALLCQKNLTSDDHSCMMDVPSWIDVRCATHALESLGAPISFGAEPTTSCSVLGVGSNGLYSVGVADSSASEALVVNGVSSDAITFFNRPYTSNQFLRSSFRHEIGISKGKLQ